MVNLIPKSPLISMEPIKVDSVVLSHITSANMYTISAPIVALDVPPESKKQSKSM